MTTKHSRLLDMARRTRRKLTKAPPGGKRLYFQGRMDAISEIVTELFDVPPDVFGAAIEDRPAPEPTYTFEQAGIER